MSGPRSATVRPERPTHAKRHLAMLLTGLLIAWAVITVGVDPANLLELPAGLALIFYEMFLESGPDWSYLPTAIDGMIESLQIAWVGTVIGAVLSLPLGFFGARNVSRGFASNVMRQILNAIRAFPEIVLAIAIFIPIAGLGPVAGALAIGCTRWARSAS